MFSNFVWRSYGSSWLDKSAEGRLGDLAREATKALSLSNFGRANHKPDIQLQGAATYGKCLKALADELGNRLASGTGSQDLLYPVLILMMHAVRRRAYL
jgi:hypothetical protein